MNTDTMNKTFDPETLADDLTEVRRIYAGFFAGLAEADWDKPVRRGSATDNVSRSGVKAI